MKFDREKFKALVHYICVKCDGDPSRLGATKLNKILYFADFANYRETGQPLTGETYVKRQFGPAPRDILVVLKELTQEKKIITRKVKFYGKLQKQYLALDTDVDLSAFSGQEIARVDDWIETICEHFTAREISDLTHDEIWQLAEIGEELPYDLVFADSFQEITEDDVAWARKVIGQNAA